MPREFTNLATILNHGFDTVIDVRSPAEFAEDHIPGAINLPALDNAERAQVGTVYKQVSPFDARKMGAAMVIRNVARHLEGPLADNDGGWRPLVYCWRGGQRSGVFATILSEIGWRAETVKGGYTSFRRLVHRTMYDDVLPHRLVLLDGNTGTAKTAILQQLRAQAVQVLDLESLARHRGSLLGQMAGGQPAQRAFETALAVALQGFDPALPVVVEAESSRIGKLIVPPALWHAMIRAPRILIKAPIAARARYLAQAYRDVIADTDRLAQRLEPLRRVRGHAIVDHWLELSRSGDLVGLSTALMTDHYDPAYAKSRRTAGHPPIAQVQARTLDDQGQHQAAAQVLEQLTTWAGKALREK